MSRYLRAALLPITMAVLIPTLILGLARDFNPGWGLSLPLNLLSLVIGIGLIAGGLTLVVLTIGLFRTVGQGTLVPWDPPRRLVVTGVYRHVRNPMISGVMGILFGEAILWGSPSLLIWALVFTGVNLIYIPLSEEPGLRRRFGVDYDEYTRHVPRWLPRITPWNPPDGDAR